MRSQLKNIWAGFFNAQIIDRLLLMVYTNICQLVYTQPEIASDTANTGSLIMKVTCL